MALINYNKEVTNLLNSLETETDHDKINEKFRAVLELNKIFNKPYLHKMYPTDLSQDLYKLGSKCQSATKVIFIDLCDEYLKKPDTNQEFIHFIKSELAFNLWNDEALEKYLEYLIEIYPTNLEFQNTMGAYHSRNKDNLKAAKYYDYVLRLHPSHSTFITNCFNNDGILFEKYLDADQIDEAGKLVKSIIENQKYIASFVHHNIMIANLARIKDHKLISDRIQKETAKEKRQLFEILGFFTAVIAFILSTVQIAQTYKFYEAIIFLILLGLVLIVFLLAIKIAFSKNPNGIFKNPIFWFAFLIIGLMFALIIIYSQINSVVSTWFLE